VSDPHKLYNMPRAPGIPARWTVVIYYRTDSGLIDVEHQIEELDMLHTAVEQGPDFHTIDRIEVRHTKNPAPELTIEQSEKL
jgi:hypothetical protein